MTFKAGLIILSILLAIVLFMFGIALYTMAGGLPSPTPVGGQTLGTGMMVIASIMAAGSIATAAS